MTTSQQLGYEPELITYQSACWWLSISRAHLYVLINRGVFHPVRLGGAPRLSLREIRQYIDERLEEQTGNGTDG